MPLQFDYFNGQARDEVINRSIRKTIDALKPQFGTADLSTWRQPVYWKYLDPSRRTADKPGLPHGDEVITRTYAQLQGC